MKKPSIELGVWLADLGLALWLLLVAGLYFSTHGLEALAQAHAMMGS